MLQRDESRSKCLPEVSSMLIISFISAIDKTISSKTGTEPPTNPVFPPWGQTANLFSLQKRKICETCSVVFGFRTQRLYPAKILLLTIHSTFISSTISQNCYDHKIMFKV